MSSSLDSRLSARRERAEEAPDLRARISELQGLLIVGMLMTGSGSQDEVEQLSLSTIPALVTCDLAALVLRSGPGWEVRGTLDGRPLPPALVAALRGEVERMAMGRPGGMELSLPGFRCTSVHPLGSYNVDVGYLVVGSRDDVPRLREARLLLQGLAAQTAASLVNARLHEEERRQARQLRSLSERLEESLARSQHILRIHEELTGAVVEGSGIQGIAEVLSRLVALPVVVEDEAGRVRAIAGAARDPRCLPPEEAERVRYRLARESRAIWSGRCVAQPVRSRGEFLASIWLAGADRDQHDDLTVVALEYAATVLAVELSHERRLAETEIRMRRDFTEELLEGLLGSDEGVLARARALGVDLDAPARVAVVQPSSGSPGRLLELIRSCVRLVVLKEGGVAFVAPEDTDWSGFRGMLVERSGDPRLAVGVGSVCRRIEEYPSSHEQARRAADLAHRAGGGLLRFDDLGVLKVLLAGGDPAALEGFTEEWLGALIRYDREHRGDLVRTLATYLDHGGNQSSTANALFIHVSTLKYHLQRIREITGFDLSDPDVRFHLQLATRARRALDVLQAAGRPSGRSERSGRGGR